LSANAIVTGSFNFTGKESGSDTSSLGTSEEATNKDVMNAISNVAAIMVDGAPLTDVYIQSLDFTLNNNIRGLQAIGHLGNADIAEGTVELTGTMNTYFTNLTMFNKFINNDDMAISIRLEKDGDAYIFTFPRVKISSDTIVPPGLNQDVMENMNFQALMHPTYLRTVQLDRFEA